MYINNNKMYTEYFYKCLNKYFYIAKNKQIIYNDDEVKRNDALAPFLF